MNTLITLAILAIVVLILEIINLRKIIVPVAVAGLLGALAVVSNDYAIQQSYFNNMIQTSTLAMSFSGLFIVLTVFLILLGEVFYKKQYTKIADYVSLKIFLLIGAVCMVSFGHFAMFFLGLEILSITLYVLAGSDFTNIKSNEAGMKYFLLGSFASGFILFGIALIYGASGTFDMNQIAALGTSRHLGVPIWFSIGLVLLTIGLLFKVAAFPFHFWAPDVYQGAPTLTTAAMSTLAKVAAVATLFKIYSTFENFIPTAISQTLVWIIPATMFVGNILALRQTNIKRMFAYSGISHAGFMLMALLPMSFDVDQDMFYYAVSYALAGIAAFSVILSVCEGKNNEDIKNFKGLAQKNPLMAVVLTLSLLSMAGIPILAGFFGKFFILSAAVKEGYIALVVLGVINSIISIGYYFRIVYFMFSKSEEEIQINRHIIYRVVAVLAILLNLLIAIYPNCVLNLV